MEQIKLSIIMPLYNVENTLPVALESILMQNVDFIYEIIAVDDCSTDKTLEVLETYAKQYSQIKIIKNEKNSGNNISFHKGIVEAKGEYFCVLDGDDYYTVNNKLQKQIDFLDNENNLDYVGVAHHYLNQNELGFVNLPASAINRDFEFNKIHFLKGSPYFHTATYVFRNIFKGANVDFFKEEILRGDSPRTFFCLHFSNKKTKVLNFFGSVYNHSSEGIYQRLSAKKRFEREIRLLDKFKSFLASPLEKNILNSQLSVVKSRANSASDEIPKQNLNANFISKEELLKRIHDEAFKHAFSEKDFMFNGYYKSEYLDSLCATIGYCSLVNNDFSPLQNRILNQEKIIIVIPSLNPQGGGIFTELTEVFEMCPDKKITVLLTDVEKLPDETLDKLKSYKNLNFVYVKDFDSERLKNVQKFIIDEAPGKIYFYVGHTDAFANALLQPNISNNVNILSYDHGFVLSLENPNYNKIIVKRPIDYWILKRLHSDKVVYIPCWNKQEALSSKYVPFNNHERVITASGVARYYKLAGSHLAYIDIILQALKETGGKHYHYGQLPEYILNKVKNFIQDNNLSEDSFVNIPWEKNLQQSFIDNKIDIFIEPFPIVSYKMTLNALAVGLPVLSYNGNTRLSKLDFIYKNNLCWATVEEFINILKSLSSEILSKQSEEALTYFNNNHRIEILQDYFLNEREFSTPIKHVVADNTIMDISDYLNIYEKPKVCTTQEKQNNQKKNITLNFRNKIRYKIWNHFNKILKRKGII